MTEDKDYDRNNQKIVGFELTQKEHYYNYSTPTTNEFNSVFTFYSNFI